MKPTLICIGIGLAALLAGVRQHARVAELETKLASRDDLSEVRPAALRSDVSATVRTGKPRARSAPPTAAEVERILMELVGKRKKTGVTGGPGAVMENREAFAAIINLDLAGQRELITKISVSTDPGFTDELYKCELINLTLCAMADRHPEAALDILNHADERIGKFFKRRIWPVTMVRYVMQRLIAADPAAGMDELVETVKRDPDSWGGSDVAEAVDSAIDQQPDVVLEVIAKLPEDRQSESWRLAVERAGTAENRERVFGHLRENPLLDRSKMSGIVGPLLRNMRKGQSWEEFASRLDEMNLSDEESKWIAPVMEGAAELGEEGNVAKWLLKSLPASEERDFLLWRTTIGFWQASDPAGAAALLLEQGIDGKEMMELERKGYLRPTH